MDIGTAKITEQEKQGVMHHLLDVLSPDEEATSGWYQLQARECIDTLHTASKVPLLVGGSMLYLSSVTDDLTMAPEGDADVRTHLEKEYDEDEGETLYKELCRVDPQTASRIHQHNKPRLIRAMELWRITGSAKSDLISGDEMRQTTPLYDVLFLGVHQERSVLVERINRRAQQMFDAGWIDEVRTLRDAGYTAEDPGMKSHGYREILEALNSGSIDEDHLREDISANTRQYAKRQMTWWKPDTRIEWIYADKSADS